jgi:hypothetical protein
MKPKQILSLLFFAVLVSFFASCEYDFIKPEPGPPPPDPTDTISFSLQVEPIWSNDNCTNCHKTGSISGLDLTAGNAYNSLTAKNLYSVADPESSRIYTYPYPGTGGHSSKYSSETEAQIILQWIQQGAKNN